MPAMTRYLDAWLRPIFRRLTRWLRWLVLLAVLVSFVPPTPPVQAATNVAPTTIVPDGVSSFTADGPLLYWVSQPADCPPGSPQPTTIQRTRTSGWEWRTVFTKLPAAGEACPYQIYSNIVADSSYLYWVDSTGVVRFPVAGSPTAIPETLLKLYFAGANHALVISDTYLWGYTGGHLWGMEKANPSHNFEIGYTGPEAADNLQWDGTYLYMIWGPSRALNRYTPQGEVKTIDTGVTSYSPVGNETECFGLTCTTHSYVYYVKQGVENALQRYDNVAGSYTTPYVSSPPPGMVARIYQVVTGVTDYTNLLYTKDVFFFEKQWTPCACFETTSTDYLRRQNMGVNAPDTIDIRASTTSWNASNLLATDGYLFWKDVTLINPANFGTLLRQPMNAAALPSINMRITDYQITQGVQDPYSSMFMVRNRVTYFRLFVKSDGADVPQVTARLAAWWDGEARDSIAPVVPLITVRKHYSNNGLSNGFLFVLPREWLLHNDLRLQPTLNPFGVPLEPNYNDNQLNTLLGPLLIRDNPRGVFHIARMSYNWQNVNYTANDYNAIVSWLYRAYPIALDPGQTAAGDQVITNNDLAKRVRDFNNTKECDYLNDTKNKTDNRNLCASYFLNDQLAALRRDGVLPKSAYIYASVVGLPRGSADPKDPVANGPDEIANNFPFAKAGFYAGHEIGHLLGRGHPNEMSDDPKTPAIEGCGHAPGDPNYPYLFTWIGDNDNPIVGFDSGVGVPVAPGASPTSVNRVMNYGDVRDVMGYCNTPDQWLSDYTYRGIFDFLTAHPAPIAPNLLQPAGPSGALVGDWLDLSGRFTPGGPAAFTLARRVDSVVDMPALTPGGYTLRLVDTGSAVLSEYPFTPEPVEDLSGWLHFGVVVPFTAGARAVQLVEDSTSLILATQPISANPPVVTSVDLSGATAPLPGTVTVNWIANDPDGNPLSYDLYYSADGGATFQPLQLGLTGSSLELDTTRLAGGMGVFRIVASDGVNTAFGDSSPIEVGAKTPEVHILTPSDRQYVQAGTPLLLTGFAVDPQDGNITSEASLSWSSQDGLLGSGPNLTVSDLPTGVITLTLTAMNSAGLSSSALTTVVVGDNLYAPPPRLSVAPGEINLQSPGEAPAIQTAQLFLSNGGGPANLDWTASTNIPWLTLDSLSGSLPFTVTLTADPAGLAPDLISSGVITVTASGAGVGPFTEVVPVSFQIGAGSIWSPPPEPDIQWLFLPIAMR